MKEKIRKIAKRTGSVLWYLILAVLVVLVVHIFAARFRGRVPKILGFSVMQVATGSMEDTIPTGSYILIREAPAQALKKGDIITFYSEDPRIYGIPNTHRIHGEPRQTDAGLSFVTKGDANPIPDKEEVPEQNVIGKYVMTLESLTAIAAFFSTRGMLVVILLIQFLCIGMTVFSILKSKKRAALLKEEQAKAMAIQTLKDAGLLDQALEDLKKDQENRENQ